MSKMDLYLHKLQNRKVICRKCKEGIKISKGIVMGFATATCDACGYHHLLGFNGMNFKILVHHKEEIAQWEWMGYRNNA